VLMGEVKTFSTRHANDDTGLQF